VKPSKTASITARRSTLIYAARQTLRLIVQSTARPGQAGQCRQGGRGLASRAPALILTENSAFCETERFETERARVFLFLASTLFSLSIEAGVQKGWVARHLSKTHRVANGSLHVRSSPEKAVQSGCGDSFLCDFLNSWCTCSRHKSFFFSRRRRRSFYSRAHGQLCRQYSRW
jgi:hypothetical protein